MAKYIVLVVIVAILLTASLSSILAQTVSGNTFTVPADITKRSGFSFSENSFVPIGQHDIIISGSTPTSWGGDPSLYIESTSTGTNPANLYKILTKPYNQITASDCPPSGTAVYGALIQPRASVSGSKYEYYSSICITKPDGTKIKLRIIDQSDSSKTRIGEWTYLQDSTPLVSPLSSPSTSPVVSPSLSVTPSVSPTTSPTQQVVPPVATVSSPQKYIITTIAGNTQQGSSGDGGNPLDARFYRPSAVAVDLEGNVYIADTNNHKIRKIINTESKIKTIIEYLEYPLGVATDIYGNVYVADTYHNLVAKIDPLGTTSIVPGPQTSSKPFFIRPSGITVGGPNGNIYVSSKSDHTIKRVDPSGKITIIAGVENKNGYSGDGGQATLAMLNYPEDVAVDPIGNIYIAEKENHRIRKVDAITKIITTFAGNGQECKSPSALVNPCGDNGLADKSQLNRPEGVAIDSVGNIYIADTFNQRIRRVDAATKIITTIAGTGEIAGFSGDGSDSTKAKIGYPSDVEVDSKGNIYITDYSNVIRKISPESNVPSPITNLGAQTFDIISGDANPRQDFYGVLRFDGKVFRFYSFGAQSTASSWHIPSNILYNGFAVDVDGVREIFKGFIGEKKQIGNYEVVIVGVEKVQGYLRFKIVIGRIGTVEVLPQSTKQMDLSYKVDKFSQIFDVNGKYLGYTFCFNGDRSINQIFEANPQMDKKSPITLTIDLKDRYEKKEITFSTDSVLYKMRYGECISYSKSISLASTQSVLDSYNAGESIEVSVNLPKDVYDSDLSNNKILCGNKVCIDNSQTVKPVDIYSVIEPLTFTVESTLYPRLPISGSFSKKITFNGEDFLIEGATIPASGRWISISGSSASIKMKGFAGEKSTIEDYEIIVNRIRPMNGQGNIEIEFVIGPKGGLPYINPSYSDSFDLELSKVIVKDDGSSIKVLPTVCFNGDKALYDILKGATTANIDFTLSVKKSDNSNLLTTLPKVSLPLTESQLRGTRYGKCDARYVEQSGTPYILTSAEAAEYRKTKKLDVEIIGLTPTVRDMNTTNNKVVCESGVCMNNMQNMKTATSSILTSIRYNQGFLDVLNDYVSDSYKTLKAEPVKKVVNNVLKDEVGRIEIANLSKVLATYGLSDLDDDKVSKLLANIYKTEWNESIKRILLPPMANIKTNEIFLLLSQESMNGRSDGIKYLARTILETHGKTATKVVEDADETEICNNLDSDKGVFNLESNVKNNKLELSFRLKPLTDGSQIKIYAFNKQVGNWQETPYTLSQDPIETRLIKDSFTGEYKSFVRYNAHKLSIDITDIIDVSAGYIINTPSFSVGYGGTVFNNLDEAKSNPISFIGPRTCDLEYLSGNYKINMPESINIPKPNGAWILDTSTFFVGDELGDEQEFISVDLSTSRETKTIEMKKSESDSRFYELEEPITIISNPSESISDPNKIFVSENDFLTASIGGLMETVFIGNPEFNFENVGYIDPRIAPAINSFEQLFADAFGIVGDKKVSMEVYDGQLPVESQSVSFQKSDVPQEAPVSTENPFYRSPGVTYDIKKTIDLGAQGKFVSDVSYYVDVFSGGKYQERYAVRVIVNLYKGGQIIASKESGELSHVYSYGTDTDTFQFNKFADKIEIIIRHPPSRKVISEVGRFGGTIKANLYPIDVNVKGIKRFSFIMEDRKVKSAFFGDIGNPDTRILVTKELLQSIGTVNSDRGETVSALLLGAIANNKLKIINKENDEVFKENFVVSGAVTNLLQQSTNLYDLWKITSGEERGLGSFQGKQAILRAVTYEGRLIRFVTTQAEPYKGIIIDNIGVPSGSCIANPDAFFNFYGKNQGDNDPLSTGQSAIIDCDSIKAAISDVVKTKVFELSGAGEDEFVLDKLSQIEKITIGCTDSLKAIYPNAPGGAQYNEPNLQISLYSDSTGESYAQSDACIVDRSFCSSTEWPYIGAIGAHGGSIDGSPTNFYCRVKGIGRGSNPPTDGSWLIPSRTGDESPCGIVLEKNQRMSAIHPDFISDCNEQTINPVQAIELNKQLYTSTTYPSMKFDDVSQNTKKIKVKSGSAGGKVTVYYREISRVVPGITTLPPSAGDTWDPKEVFNSGAGSATTFSGDRTEEFIFSGKGSKIFNNAFQSQINKIVIGCGPTHSLASTTDIKATFVKAGQTVKTIDEKLPTEICTEKIIDMVGGEIVDSISIDATRMSGGKVTIYYKETTTPVTPEQPVVSPVTSPISQLPTIDIQLKSATITSKVPYSFEKDYIQFTAEICVNGDKSLNDIIGDSSLPLTIDIIDESGSAISTTAKLMSEKYIKTLKGGACHIDSEQLISDKLDVYDKTKRIDFVIDKTNIIPETDESNNKMSCNGKLALGIGDVCSSTLLTPPSLPSQLAGLKDVVIKSVQNIGSETSPKFMAKVCLVGDQPIDINSLGSTQEGLIFLTKFKALSFTFIRRDNGRVERYLSGIGQIGTGLDSNCFYTTANYVDTARSLLNSQATPLSSLYRVELVTDPNNMIDETDETNNKMPCVYNYCFPSGKIDLETNGITVSTSGSVQVDVCAKSTTDVFKTYQTVPFPLKLEFVNENGNRIVGTQIPIGSIIESVNDGCTKVTSSLPVTYVEYVKTGKINIIVDPDNVIQEMDDQKNNRLQCIFSSCSQPSDGISGPSLNPVTPILDFNLNITGPTEINEGENANIHFSGIPAGEEGKVTYYFNFNQERKGLPTSNAGEYDDKRTIDQINQYGSTIRPLYVTTGTYTVSIFALSESGKKAWAYHSLKVRNVPPTANAGRDITVKVGDVVPFNAGGSYAGDFDETFFYWDVDAKDGLSFSLNKESADLKDAAPQTLPNAHSYSNPGVYIATVRVYDDDGSYADDTVTVTVTDSSGRIVPAVITSTTPSTGCDQFVLNKATSNFGTVTADIGYQYVVFCDYGKVNVNYIDISAPGSDCKFDAWVYNTAAAFLCTATTPTTNADIGCRIKPTLFNNLACGPDKIGSLTIRSSSPTPSPSPSTITIVQPIITSPSPSPILSPISSPSQTSITYTIKTIAGTGSQVFGGDSGQAISASLNFPSDVVFDSQGNLYVLEWSGARIRKITPSGAISTFAGTGTSGLLGDGGPATSAQIDSFGISIDSSDNIYLVDTYNNRIRKISTSGIITTVPGSIIGLNTPYNMVVDSSGNMYISDTYNHKIKKLSSSGVMTDFAGTGIRCSDSSDCGDGVPALSAKFTFPQGLAFDSSGNLYVADRMSNMIRKITPSGTITTIAGSKQAGSSGDDGPATQSMLSGPTDVALDSSNNLYILDQGNQKVRKIDASGKITTVAGTGSQSFSGDNGPAKSASMNNPEGIGIDSQGNVYIADTRNNRIRKLSPQ